VLKTYAKNSGFARRRDPLHNKRHGGCKKCCRFALKEDVAAVSRAVAELFSERSNRIASLAEIVHAAGAMFVAVITEGVSLGPRKASRGGGYRRDGKGRASGWHRVYGRAVSRA